MLALDSIMVSKCPKVYRISLFLMTCLNMLLKFDHLIIEYALYSIGIPVEWGRGKDNCPRTMWHWKSFSASILILPKQLTFECSIFICIHLTVAEYSLATDINERKTVK